MNDVVERMAEVTHRKVKWFGGHDAAHRRRVRHRSGGSAQWSEGDEPTMEKPVALVSCSVKDGLTHAHVLRSELAFILGRPCAVGGGAQATAFIADCETLIVLLTKNLPTDPAALHEIWTALRHGVTLVSVVIAGGGFDFEEAAFQFSDLPAALEKKQSGRTAQLQSRLPSSTDIVTLGQTLHCSLTAIIAIPWSPHHGDNHRDAVINDIVQRMPSVQNRLSRFFIRPMSSLAATAKRAVLAISSEEQQEADRLPNASPAAKWRNTVRKVGTMEPFKGWVPPTSDRCASTRSKRTSGTGTGTAADAAL
eukprot:2507018-Prymnesium_polylepis.2